VDCTYGRGHIWGRLPYRPVRADINPELPKLDLVADWRDLAQYFSRGSVDVLCWDPIHVADVGRTSRFYGHYVAPSNPVRGESVVELYPEFLAVAAALVKPVSGIGLVKLSDQVHSGRQQWQVFEFVAEAQRRNWTACDYRIVWSPKKGPDPKHKRQYHSRNQWSFWIVLRNGLACRGPGIQLTRAVICVVCGRTFAARRSDARTCDDTCRQRLRRARSVTTAND
jgi:hypothetical protein